jgi:hypothetical protein
MKPFHSKTRALIFLAAMVLLVIAFPSTLHASQSQIPELNSITFVDNQPLTATQPYRARAFAHSGDGGERESLLLDQDIRVRAATVLFGDPIVKISAQSSDVPLTVVVIAAPVILDA